MTLNKFVVVVFVTLGVMTSAFAASNTRELSIDGNYVSVQGGPTASLLNVSLGQLLTPQFAIVTVLSTQENFAYTATSIGLGGKFYFMDGFKGDLVPFAGLGIAMRQYTAAGKSNNASTQFDISLGLAYFLADNTTLDIKARSLNFNDSSPSVFQMTAGFSQRF